jgi:hypothetical protein
LAFHLKEKGCKTSFSDVMHDVGQMKASLVRINGEEQIIRTELQGDANLAFEAIGTKASARVVEKPA